MTQPLSDLGWGPFFQQQWEALDRPRWGPARVAAIFRSHCIVWTTEGPQDVFLKEIETPQNLAVGDWLYRPTDPTAKIARLQRHHWLARQAPGGRGNVQLMAANVEDLWIVMACDQPPQPDGLAAFCVLAAEAELEPLLVLTKIDQVDEPDAACRWAVAVMGSWPWLACDARDADQLEPLRQRCRRGRTIALVGPSGVGKSTLVNRLAGVEQPTFPVSQFNRKGQHTTTERSCHRTVDGAILIDTPGMRSPQLLPSPRGMEAVYPDITALLARCRFADCRHQGDQAGCAVQEALQAGTLQPERWERFRRLQEPQDRFQQTIEQREAIQLGRRRPRRRR